MRKINKFLINKKFLDKVLFGLEELIFNFFHFIELVFDWVFDCHFEYKVQYYIEEGILWKRESTVCLRCDKIDWVHDEVAEDFFSAEYQEIFNI